jgi:cytochrome P450
MLRRIFREPTTVLDELAAHHGRVVGLGAGPARMAIIGDPDALSELFAMPTDHFRWNHRFNVLGFVVGDESMIVSDGGDHRRRRSAVQSGFSRRRLNGWIPMMVDRVDAAIDRVLTSTATDGAVDLYPVTRGLTLDVVVRSMFGGGMATRVDEIGELFARPQAYLESPAVRQLPHPFPFTRRARVRADRRAFDAIVDAELADRRRHRVADADDLLSVLALDGTLTDGEIRDQVDSLIGAGYHTTAASLSWMIWCAVLAGWWERLRTEADDAFGTEPWDHTLLMRLELAGRVMRETLRLHPAGVVGVREAVVDVDVGGYRVPAGSMIIWSPYLAGRDPVAWPDPLRFDPDRFGDPAAERRARASGAWAPFGGGARNCIGFALAQMELTIAIARFAQRLDLAPVEARLPRPVGMVVSRPEGGVPMRIGPRAGTVR